jgi:type III secretion protein T
VTSALPTLRPDAVSSFEGALGRIMLLMLMLAGPVLVVLYVIDAALGLVNRYAPSINLLTIAPPVKSLLALGVVMVLLGSIIDLMVVEFTQKLPAILGVVRSMFVP